MSPCHATMALTFLHSLLIMCVYESGNCQRSHDYILTDTELVFSCCEHSLMQYNLELFLNWCISFVCNTGIIWLICFML